jgi:hypothetical protein
MGAHLIDGEFQSDKYPTTPRGKVPLSVKDTTAQDLLWEYAQRRRSVDPEFANDLETALKAAGYSLPAKAARLTPEQREIIAEHGPYVLRDDGCLEDCNGVGLVRLVPDGGVRCEWDEAVVAVLNTLSETKGEQR